MPLKVDRWWTHCVRDMPRKV